MSGSAEPLATNLISKPRTKLIALNKEKKILYFGPCSNVEINAAAQCLILTTNSTIKWSTEVVSTYNRIFIQQENALCVIDEGKTNKNFMVIFSSKELCDQVFEAITKAKYPNITPPPKNDPSTEDNLFKNNFYIPILKEIKLHIPGFKEIQETILEVVNLFEADKRKLYLNMIFDILVSSTPVDSDDDEIDSVQDSTVSSNTVGVGIRKSSVFSNVETFVDDDTVIGDRGITSCTESDRTLNDSSNSTNQSFNETTKIGYGNRKRSCPNYDETKLFESEEINRNSPTPTVKKSLLSTATTSTDGIHSYSISQILSNVISANYKLVKCFSYGLVRERLLIFTSKGRTECYEFYYSAKQEWHACKNCITKKSLTSIKIISVQNGQIEFCFGQQEKHVCKPVKFSPQNFSIIESSVINKNNMNFEKLDNIETEKKNGRQSGIRKVIKSPNFQFVDQMFTKRLTRKLIIFEENERSLCREYTVGDRLNQKYFCSDCRNKHNHHVGAKFIKSEDNGNNGDIIELGYFEHLCEPKNVSLNSST